jgi:hypothetical protein
MRILFGSSATKSTAIVSLLALISLGAATALISCSPKAEQQPDQPPETKVDKPFAAAGDIEMQLDSGDYIIRASPDEHIRVSFAGNIGDAAADLGTNGTHANLTVKDTPHNNFRATVEVPATSGLTVHLKAGNLEIAAIAGSKDIDTKAGNVGISIPNANDYGAVDAAVTVGNLDAGPFGDSGSGLSPHLKWSGPGKYTLHASLGAGNLELKR